MRQNNHRHQQQQQQQSLWDRIDFLEKEKNNSKDDKEENIFMGIMELFREEDVCFMPIEFLFSLDLFHLDDRDDDDEISNKN